MKCDIGTIREIVINGEKGYIFTLEDYVRIEGCDYKNFLIGTGGMLVPISEEQLKEERCG